MKHFSLAALLLILSLIFIGCQTAENDQPPQSRVAAPTFNPPAGTYPTPQNVTISTATSGATIRYTVDGSAPASNHGTVYSGPVDISGSTTLRALAYKTGWDDSAIAAAAYTITGTNHIFLSGKSVSDDDPNNTIIGEFRLEYDPHRTVTYALTDNAGNRFKVSDDRLLLNDYTLIDSAAHSSHTIVVEATVDSTVLSDSFDIDVTKTNDFEVRPTVNSDPILGRPAIASNGTDFMIAWIEYSAVRCTRVSSEGQILDAGGITIGQTSGYPGYPSVAFDGMNYLIVWADSEVFGVRIDPNGTVIDGNPRQITQGANAKLRAPSIVFDGHNYFVAWRTNDDQIKGARIAVDASIIDDQAGIMIGTGYYPWVAFDGTNYLVVWHRYGNNGLDIYGNRVSSTTASVLDGSGFAICEAVENQDHSSVAFDGTNYLVVWHDFRGGDLGYNDGSIYGARISTSGQVLDSPAFCISDLCRGQVPVLTIFDGDGFFVVWQVDHTHIEATSLVDIYSQKITGSGELVGDPIPITAAHGHQFGPVLGQSASQYFVAWNEGGRGWGVWGRLVAKW